MDVRTAVLEHPRPMPSGRVRGWPRPSSKGSRTDFDWGGCRLILRCPRAADVYLWSNAGVPATAANGFGSPRRDLWGGATSEPYGEVS